MVSELELSGNELLLYGLIYGFSKDGVSSFYGNYDYIKEHTGIKSEKTVTNVLNSLLGKGLIVKENRYTTSGKSNGYRVVFDDEDCERNIIVESNVDVPGRKSSKIEVDEDGFTYEAKVALGLIEPKSVDSGSSLESYNSILESFGVTNKRLFSAYIEFIKFCSLNKHFITNDKLERLIVKLDLNYGKNDNAKINALQEAINLGYFYPKVK